MEAYRSYPDDRSYPEGPPGEPGYAEGPAWYGDRRVPDPPAADPLHYEDPLREPHRDLASPADAYRDLASAPDPHLGPPGDQHRPPPVRPEPGRVPPIGPPGPVGSPAHPPPAHPPPPIAAARRPGPPPGEEPSFARRPPAAPGSPGPLSDGVYRSRRPAVAALVGVPAALLEIPVLLLLADAGFGEDPFPSGVVAASCLALALPLLAMGLYAVATGAVRAAGPNSAQAWLRPPVAYLTVGLVLVIAAGLAA